MRIHWFPGHMTKALRMLESELSVVDVVVYVLDARAPVSTLSPAFDKLIEKKPVVYVLNKADLIDRSDLYVWKGYFDRQDKIVVMTNSTAKTGKEGVLKAISTATASVKARYKNKGVEKTIRAMIIGVPNSGKSTLINSLVNSKKAMTGNRPGVTKGKQWVTVDDHLDLLDSPGVTYPDFADESKALKLAIIGSIKDEVTDVAELGFEFLCLLLRKHSDAVATRYSISDIKEKQPIEIMECIGARRGVPLSRGEHDYERIARVIISDYRKGLLGKFALETPDEF